MDLFPTILEAAGVDAPGDIRGRSFLPLLQGRASLKGRTYADYGVPIALRAIADGFRKTIDEAQEES